MGLFSFIQEAGDKLFGADSPEEVAAKIQKHIEKQKLGLTDLRVSFDAAQKMVKLEGFAPDREAFEKAALTAGNVNGINIVYNLLKLPHHVAEEAAKAAVAAAQAASAPQTEAAAAPAAAEQAAAPQAGESRYHDVEKGDTLSAIAKKYYGDANQYNKIFEANKPMLSDPNKIYPGQKLRIPE